MSELTMEETHKSTLEDYPSSLPERHDMNRIRYVIAE